jgi:hypothetical protein
MLITNKKNENPKKYCLNWKINRNHLKKKKIKIRRQIEECKNILFHLDL